MNARNNSMLAQHPAPDAGGGALRLGAALLAMGLLSACETPPDTVDNGGTPPACDGCHKLEDLTKAPVSEGPRQWMQKSGRGLTRISSLTPSGVKEFTLNWPRRGNHPSYSLKQCSDCHPVSSEGVRHGLSQYPVGSRAAAYLGDSAGCAPSCHGWLKEEVKSTGFTPKQGDIPIYIGSIMPDILLTASRDAHKKIYQLGYVKKEGSSTTTLGLQLGRIKPGCAGCHNTRNDKHGEITPCLDCHVFGGLNSKAHQDHVTVITKGQATIDPGKVGSTACEYCHALTETPTTLHRSACYGCHLSGHQVNNPATGKPHFWKL